jgi:hypothetical protein
MVRRVNAMTAPMLGRTTFPTSRLRDFCSRKELITSADVAFLEGDLIVDLIDTKVTTMGITKMVPEPDVIASAYRRACQIGTLNHALEAAAEDADGEPRRSSCPRTLSTASETTSRSIPRSRGTAASPVSRRTSCPAPDPITGRAERRRNEGPTLARQSVSQTWMQIQAPRRPECE